MTPSEAFTMICDLQSATAAIAYAARACNAEMTQARRETGVLLPLSECPSYGMLRTFTRERDQLRKRYSC